MVRLTHIAGLAAAMKRDAVELHMVVMGRKF